MRGTRFAAFRWESVAAALYRAEGRRAILWLPVAQGVGVILYFGLDVEPDPIWAAMPILPTLALMLGVRRAGWGAALGLWLAFMGTAGFSLALASAHLAAAPVIDYPVGRTVEGRIVEVSRSASGAPRMLLDDILIYGLDATETPRRVRLTALDTERSAIPPIGTRVRTYATLLPAGEPVEPGAFDFHRRAFFDGLGAVGLVRAAILRVPQTEQGMLDTARLWVAALRARIADGLRAALPGREGAFAAAIIVGDRSEIPEEDAEALRISSLAHLLAISGLHMGILTGLIFAVTRFGLAAIPSISLHMPTKKFAAAAAILAGLAYLVLSGATVATQRAFVMVCVALFAVLLGRPAISMRALALAAVIVMVVRPISVLDAGFQMSFAATAALVAGYEAVGRRMVRAPKDGGLLRRVAGVVAVFVIGVLFTSLLAGLATAPFSAFHFNRLAPYALVANLFAVPVMGLLIAPAAVAAGVLAPFGLSDPALWSLGRGITWVLEVAHGTAALPGAARPVAAAPEMVLGIVALGGLILVLFRGPWRHGGLAVIAVALGLWWTAPPRPDVLVAPGARLIGVMGPEGRALDHDKAVSFAAKTWLRRDGDAAEQAVAAARPGLSKEGRTVHGSLPAGWSVTLVHDRRPDAEIVDGHCHPDRIVIVRYGPSPSGPCIGISKDDLEQSGALAVRFVDGAPSLLWSRDPQVRRLWTR